MQGRSLVPLLRGDSPVDWRQSFYYHYYEGRDGPHAVAQHFGVATERYKLIHYYNDGEWELFDHVTDPHELKSLYGDASLVDQQAELKAELTRVRAHLAVID